MQDTWVKLFFCPRQHHKLLVLCPTKDCALLCFTSVCFNWCDACRCPFHPHGELFCFSWVNSPQIDAFVYVCMCVCVCVCVCERWCRCADNHDKRRKHYVYWSAIAKWQVALLHITVSAWSQSSVWSTLASECVYESLAFPPCTILPQTVKLEG